jgi:hypothetical protein
VVFYTLLGEGMSMAIFFSTLLFSSLPTECAAFQGWQGREGAVYFLGGFFDAFEVSLLPLEHL